MTACAIRRKAWSRPARRPSPISARIETPDPLTVVFKMKNVNAAMLEHFASPWNTIYSAKDLAADPAAPRTKINGTGPFIFVEHVKGSHVAGKKNPDYFKKDLPYLDGFRGIFTLQAAAMLNAVQGAQVLGEFRGISPAERDRLVSAMGDKIRIEESSWTLNLLVVFNTEKKPFDDVRVRRALLMAIDRWGGSQGLSRISTLRSVGGVIRPGLADGDAGSRTCEAAGLLQGHQEVPRGGQEAAGRSRRTEPQAAIVESQSRDALYAGRHFPGRPMAADRSRGRARTVRHRQISCHHDRRAISTSRSTSPTCSWTIPASSLAKYLSVTRAPENRSRSNDPELDKLYDEHMRERDPEKRKALIRAFEKRAVRAGLSAAAVVVAPHRADPQDGDGLENVAQPQSRRRSRRSLAAAVTRHWRSPLRPVLPATRATPGHESKSMLRYTINRVLLTIPTLLGVAVLVFFMLRIVPGDVVEVKLRGDGGSVSQADDRGRAQAARPRQAAADAIRRLDGRRCDAQFRQVDVDRAAGDGGNRACASNCRCRSRSWRRSSRS